jgi:aspartate/methionine/tyrosine aminotransferase
MHELAKELNTILDSSMVGGRLSELGRSFYFPKGIVAQTAEAKQHAHRFNVTAGMAYHEGKPMYLTPIRESLPDLSPEEIFPYVTTSGDPTLRKLWKEEMLRKNPALAGKSTSLPLVVSGLTHGLSMIGDLFLDRGDVVVLPDMFWGNYQLIFGLRRGAGIACFPFFDESGGLNIPGLIDTVKQQAENGRICLLLNFPNNPTGYSPTREEAEELAEALRGLAKGGIKMVVATDDAYFGLFYEEETFQQSLFSLLADCHENILAVKVDGATKEELAWGFRVGFLTFAAPGLTEEHHEALQKKCMGLIRSTISNTSRPAQSLIVKALRDGSYREEKQKAYDILKGKYLAVKRILNAGNLPPNLKPLPFNAGYFMCFDCKNGDAEALRQKLLHGEGVGTVSSSGRYLRIAYSMPDAEQLEELYRIIFRTAART